jgi:tetratricopeptide (TPR) repeat protein
MMTVAAFLKFFEEDIDLRSVMLGLQDLPPFPGKPASPWHRLYTLARAAHLLQLGSFEAAAAELQTLKPGLPALQSQLLVTLWLEAETGDLEQAYAQICHFIDAMEQVERPQPQPHRPAALYQYDRKISRGWAYVLRLYITSLLPEITHQQVEQCGRDIASARANQIQESTLMRMDFLVRFAMARQFHSVDQVVVAARDWQELCREYPMYGTGYEYHLEVIMALEYDNRFNDVLAWIDESLPHFEDPYEFLIIQARTLKRIGRVQESLAICEHLIARYPNDFSGYTLRSNAHFLIGENDKAMADAQLACRMDPDNPNSYLARAFVLLQIGHYSQALADFEKTLELDPQRYDAMRGQGKCLSMLGRDYEALASFQKLKRAFPDDPDVYYEIADVLFAAGYLDECEKACRQCLQLDNSYVSAYVILGMVAMRRNDDDKARRLLNHAVAMEPDNPFALNELSYLTHLDGDEDRAIELVDRAIAESPDYADALCNKGVIHYFRSEFEQASSVFEQTLRLMPDHVGALVGKGNTLIQLNEFDEAQACYDLALELEPDNADACHGKAMMYRMLGLDDEVRYWQERAARLEGDDDE